MVEETKAAPSNEELMAMIKSMNEAKKPEGGSGWEKKAAPAGSSEIKSVSVPISVETDEGKIRIYLSFSGEVAESPESIMALIKSLGEKGLPLDIWRKKKEWNNKKKW